METSTGSAQHNSAVVAREIKVEDMSASEMLEMLPKEEDRVEDKGPELVEKTDLKEDTPFTEYSKLEGVPYSVKHFKVQGWEHIKGNPILDVDGIAKAVRLVEWYVKDKIDELELEDNVKTYKKLIDSVCSAIGVMDEEKPEAKLKRIAAYARRVKNDRASN